MDFRAWLSGVFLLENKKVVFLLLFLALSAIVLNGWLGISYLVGQQKKSALEQRATAAQLLNLQQRTAERLSANALALVVMAHSDAINKLALAPDTLSPAVKRVFTALTEFSTDIYQVRFIDAEGWEKVRVDKSDSGIVYKNEDTLQYKGGRAYFRDSINLAPRQVYVSPIDLNREYGRIEEPWQPTIRLALAVYAGRDRAQGILIANVSARHPLETYRSRQWPDNEELSLLNPDGFWIEGKPEHQLWGFLLEGRPGFAEQNPKAWETIKAGPETLFPYKNSIYTAIEVTAADLLTLPVPLANPNKTMWYALHEKKRRGLTPTLVAFLPALAILITLAAFSWTWAKNLAARKKAEKELIKSEKMSSLGSLVAGVAHELNTPLGCAVTTSSAVIAKAREVKKSIASGRINKSEIVEFVDDMNEAGEIMQSGLAQANDLVSHFKHVAVDQTVEQQRVFDLDEYIAELATTFQHLFKGRKVYLKLTLQTDAELYNYPGALGQVIINLVQNSLNHGFDENEEGVVEITTSWADKNHVAISVTDNGKGIPPRHKDKIFEPFFTTKMGQGGTGLGLNIVHNIVNDQIQGVIKVVSDETLRFTKFTVTLPCNQHLIKKSKKL